MRLRRRLREVLDFQPFPTQAFPEPIRGLIRAGSAALNVDESFIGTAALPVLAAAVGNLAVVELKPGWTEPSILWAGFIGDSGTLKSPTLDIVMKPILRTGRRMPSQSIRKRWRITKKT